MSYGYDQLTHQRVYDRLMSLVYGASPCSDVAGICYDIDNTIFGGQVSDYCSTIFAALGMERTYPLSGKENDRLQKWEGENGVLRRALCAKMAQYIKETYLS